MQSSIDIKKKNRIKCDNIYHHLNDRDLYIFVKNVKCVP